MEANAPGPPPGWTCVCGAHGLQGTSCAWCGRWAWWYRPPGPPLPPPLPPRAGLDLRGKLLAAAVVVLVVAGLGGVVRHGARERAARNVVLGAAVDELAAFVAERHGAPFHSRIRVRLLGDRAFDRAIYGDDEYYEDEPADDEEPADFGATMLALGLAEPAGAGSDDDGDDDGPGDALGFYDSDADVLYVRGEAVTPFTKMVLVHELAHAWQDQHHDLSRLQDSAEDADHYAAIEALVEGDAMRIENDWRAAQGAEVRAAIDAHERALDAAAGDALPDLESRVLGVLGDFPYSVGERFARAVYASGGNQALTKAFEGPPRSTEQIIDPARYFAAQHPVEVTPPGTEGALLDSGVLGQLGLSLVVGGGDVDRAAIRAASGWDGDSYVTWRNSRGVCTEAAVATDSPRSRDALVAALRKQAAAGREVTTPGPKQVLIRYCVDPGR